MIKVTALLFIFTNMLLFQNCNLKSTTADKNPINSDLTPDSILNYKRLLWIGAHPDDEIPLSPLLKEFCKKQDKSCMLLTLTLGENGRCKLSLGCLPDLAFKRTNEFINSGKYLNADVFQFDFGDSLKPTINGIFNEWTNKMANISSLEDLLINKITEFKPDIIFTFDPRHGTTCHPAHRAAGELVISASKKALFPRESLYMIESIITGVGGSSNVGFRSAVLEDKNVQEISYKQDWTAPVNLMRYVYKSQYFESESILLSQIPIESQIISLLPFVNAQDNDYRYFNLCTN